jgi:hypothetical protein
MLSIQDFSQRIALLHFQCKPEEIPVLGVPLVEFVYLFSDIYKSVRASLLHQLVNNGLKSCLYKVFHLLDLVAYHDQDLFAAAEREALACASFAGVNNLPVVQFLYNRGFNWDERTLFGAVQGKSVACFTFAFERQRPLLPETVARLRLQGNVEKMGPVLNDE